MIISTFRLTEEMHTYLTAWAKREHRSLHSLIVWILAQAIHANKERSE